MNGYPSKLFFVIDSDNLQNVKTKLYGYCITKDGIFFNKKSGKIPTLDGSYVYIQRNSNKITITQDAIGSFGLYVYQKENYFAISNSLLNLCEYLKNKVNLSLDKQYVYSFIESDLCSYSYNRTFIEDIKIIDMWDSIEIELSKKSINILKNKHDVGTVEIYSNESIRLLDKWYNKWSTIIKKLQNKSVPICVDLSGGIDSRLVFSLFLNNGVDLSRINVKSINNSLHTFSEDYQIATNIANRFKFSLNTNNIASKGSLPLQTNLLISSMLKMGSHKLPACTNYYYPKCIYHFSGCGGECIRDYWAKYDYSEFLEKQSGKINQYPLDLYITARNHIKNNIDESLKLINVKYPSESGSTLIHKIFNETYSRFHFGRSNLEKIASNEIMINPLLDIELLKIKCHGNQLPALILSRYASLEDIQFEGGRTLTDLEITQAKKINEKYPFKDKNSDIKDFILPETYTSQTSMSEAYPFKKIADTIDNLSKTKWCEDTIKASYDEYIYTYLMGRLESESHFPLQYSYVALTIAVFGEIVEASRKNHQTYCPAYADISKLLEEETFYKNKVKLREYIKDKKYTVALDYIPLENKDLRDYVWVLAQINNCPPDKDLETLVAKTRSLYENNYYTILYTVYDYLEKSLQNSNAPMRDIVLMLETIPTIEAYYRIYRAYLYSKGVDRNIDKALYWVNMMNPHIRLWANNDLFDVLWENNTPETD